MVYVIIKQSESEIELTSMVSNRITSTVSNRITSMVSNRITSMVSNRITSMVSNRITSMVSILEKLIYKQWYSSNAQKFLSIDGT